MSKLRNISREGWMVFTAVLAAIAVIAAMVTVPGVKAEAAEPADFVPNTTLGDENFKEEKNPQHFAADYDWGLLVWAGKPAGKGFGNGGSDKNDVGWAWCIEPHAPTPLNTKESYEKKNATKLEYKKEYHDAVINLGRKMEAAAARGDSKSAANYYVYLLMFYNSPGQNPKNQPYETIIENSKKYFPAFTGSHEEFTELTGYKIEGTSAIPKLVKDSETEIAKQPADAYITVVHPNNNRGSRAQSVIPVDQPGLPDEPDNGGDTEEPTTSPEAPNTEENPSDETTPENPGEETTPNSETTTDSEPSNTEETTPKDSTTEPTSPDETTKVTEPTAPVPGTEEQEKDLNPEIKTEAKIKDGNRVEKGATVIDTVTYKDLVPGKKYTLKAKLISKADGKTVLGEGSAELVPEESAGEKEVEITVNDKADPAVDAAVAFEKLVSTEVDKDGNETSGSTDENEIATHENINDEKQTVNTKWTPSIHTNADFDNAKQVKAGVTVKDTVTYTDLVPGKEYTLKAELHNKAADENGDYPVVGKGDVTFTPKKSAGEQVVDIKVNDDVKGVIKAAVAFEDLYSKQVDENGKETPNSDEEKKITDHRDIDDEAQTVTSKMEPSIGTKAEKAEGDEIKAGTVITDKVKYNDLVAGKEYTLNAELRSKVKDETTGDYPVIGHGEKTFVPSASKGEVEVEITVDEGVTEAVDEAVAFEYLTSTAVNKDGEDSTTGEKNDIAEHTNIDDDDQTVTSEDEPETSTPETTTPKDDVPETPDDGDKTSESEEPGDSESEKPSESEEPSESSEPSESESVETTASEASETSESDKPSDGESTTPDKPTEPSESTEPNEPGTPGDDEEKDTPKISTNADFEGGLREVVAGAKVVDQVSYEGLVPGKQYTLDAQLISKEDGKTVLGETKGHKFTPDEANGTEAVTIVVNDDVTEPVQAAVAFEYLTSTEVNENGDDEPTDEGTPNDIAKHDDINDKDQTVTSKPRISTNADFADGSKEVVAGATVIDTVDYFNLIPGKEYKLNAELISKKDGKTVLGKGEATVKPESANGQAKVEITVSDDVKEPVEAAVAFEELTSTDVNDKGEDTPDTTPENPNDIAEHKDINDENQTVTSHKNAIVSTNADFEGDLREVVAGAEIVDQVSYEGLVPGKEYSLDAQLISKEDGKTVLGETKGHTFKPEAADGVEAVTITVNDDVTEPVEAAVAFETLTSKVVNDKGEDTPDNDKPNEIGEHKDINDEDQTVTSEDEPETSAPETTTPKDDVPGTPDDGDKTCESEEPGDSESEQPSESEEPSESESSEPSESESVETTSSEASETSESDKPSDCGSTTPEKPSEPSESTEPNEPGTPGDNDEKDTPKVSTNADFEGDLREVVAGAKVVDQVSYEGLVPGKQYTLDAQLISKEDGKTVLGETKGHKFTPDEANGTEAVTIVVNDDVTEPVEAAVAFETLTSTQVDKHGENNPTDEDNPNPVGEHKDINDEDQTVTSEDSEKTPKITTNADFEKGSHAVVAGAKIVDEVTYEGLVPGKEYTLKAELINKKDGKSVLGTGEATFTPKKSKGMEPVTITVNDDVKEPVQAAVAFEELTSTEVNDKGEDTPDVTPEKPNHIAEHKDINDEDQTVTSHEVHDQDTPGGSSDGSSNGSSHGSSKGKTPWWLILIPGIGLGKIIKDHHDHNDHGNHNGGHGDNTGNHDGGNGKHTDGHNGGNGHEDKGQDAPQGGNSDNGHGRSVEVQGQQPEETGNALPSNAERVEIKSVPSGATELEPGMQDYIK
ncbi:MULTISPECIES: VaFE repeat-containing surface-anchored protein [unclassified Corynebacterium]|uniref:VaFE repeat-containing surface-anchored protein n=1 Tax=unclassified Corynebacterium TaxID=2624378 RepID=UPI00254CCBD4|nr:MULTISPECIES: VaFE repeat-containing surface-anchored protein [unclassified Corynebacterium]MDK8525389.1 VaFE repeat-containing surface-anchored protein [Corynebacterium sp. MSK150]MDK8670642.1 VaFE repeat-containing surface-anchored protein [Corynebacterium sp. MSK195]